jgi:predicted dehydrogenase
MTTPTTTPAVARVVSPILRVGIVGCGNIADNHFQALTALPHVEVVGVADVDRARARSFAGERGIPRAVTSLLTPRASPSAISSRSPNDR